MDRKSIIKRLALASVSLGYGEEQSLDLSISFVLFRFCYVRVFIDSFCEVSSKVRKSAL